jgi:hypothetical protein
MGPARYTSCAMLLNNGCVIVLLLVAWIVEWSVLVIVRRVKSHRSFSFLTSTTMATPEAALKLEIARLTGIISPLAYVDVFS